MSSGFVLLSRFPSFQPARFPLPEGLTTIGRSSACDFIIRNDTVSRQHAEIEVAGQTATIRDLGSSNGTLLDGLRISESPFLLGQRLQFGQVDFLVVSVDVHDFELESTDETPPIVALAGTASKSTLTDALLLSPQQRRVFDMLLDGHSEKTTARLMDLSQNTVHNYVREIYRACGVHSRAELLALYVVREGDDRRTNG